MPLYTKGRLSVNSNPTGLDSLIKRLVLGTYAWGLISADRAQHLINRFQLWSA